MFMKTTLILLIITLSCSLQLVAQETKEVCDCPKPTEEQFLKVCNSIYAKKRALDEDTFGYKFAEDLWEMSCAKVGIDSPEQAKQKIQCMWNKYKEDFSCPGDTGTRLHNANVLKYSMDSGFSSFLITAVKKYELDVNFKDPMDKKTVLDFISEQLVYYRNSSMKNVENEYQRVYDLLRKNGAKHSNEL